MELCLADGMRLQEGPGVPGLALGKFKEGTAPLPTKGFRDPPLLSLLGAQDAG